jgi:ferredoxin
MGHTVNAKEEVYRALAERLNRMPVGAPVNEILMEILYRLYTESEAAVGSKFPMVPMTLDKIVGITGMKREVLKKTLDDMADKGLVLDLPRRECTYYMLAPMMSGFFEFTFMRVRDSVNMKELAELFERYLECPEMRDELSGSDTKLFQTLVYESLIPAAVETEVLTYEKASAIIRQSGGGTLSLCSCKHKASHLGKACGAPMEVCTSLGHIAKWIAYRGMGKPATVDELLRVLDQTEKLGLVHLGDNVLNQPAYICHCCGCCCEVLRSIREHGKLQTHPSNFIPTRDTDSCTGCGTCADSCHIKAIVMRDTGGGIEAPDFDRQICLGCGVCASSCPSGALTMSRREVLHVPPENKMEQLTRIAREKGRI